jgi:hypothetical protein
VSQAGSKIKLGHCGNQTRPLGGQTGQYPRFRRHGISESPALNKRGHSENLKGPPSEISDGKGPVPNFGYAQPANPNLIPPAIFIELGLKSVRHSGCLAGLRRVTARAGHSGRAAGAGAISLPRTAGMLLADPSAIEAQRALHANNSAPDGVNFTNVPLSCITR